MDTTFEATVDENGTIRLPRIVSSRLGLHPGTVLVVEQTDEGGASLRIESVEVVLLNERGVLVADTEVLVDINDLIHQQRSARIHHLLGDDLL
jgi:bifunctional DNA-binding transcriptional regulator/antitoxin component of YhaV-PrlF toxin-antitoxin module